VCSGCRFRQERLGIDTGLITAPEHDPAKFFMRTGRWLVRNCFDNFQPEIRPALLAQARRKQTRIC
jgi:hypothetical protein